MFNAIEVNHLTKKLGDFSLKGIDFSVDEGYVLGVIGKNGAGKTTLINTILGLYKPDSGKIKIAGYDRVDEGVDAKNAMAFVMDECLFPLGMSAKDIGKTFGSLYKEFEKKHYESLCMTFKLPYRKSLKRMSKGMQIKVQLAFALSYNAKLYIFDEPSAGLDPVFRRELVDFIFDIIKDGDKSVIFCTHLTEELDRFADYILFLENGEQLLFDEKENLVSKYQLIKGEEEELKKYKDFIIGQRITEHSCEALVERVFIKEGLADIDSKILITPPTIEDIMYYFIKGSEG